MGIGSSHGYSGNWRNQSGWTWVEEGRGELNTGVGMGGKEG